VSGQGVTLSQFPSLGSGGLIVNVWQRQLSRIYASSIRNNNIHTYRSKTAPTTKIAGEFDVCVLKNKTKMFTGFDDECENLSCE
jgi:hypothetical protein